MARVVKRAPAVRAVSTDRYRYRSVLTARTGQGCKHGPVQVPVRAYSQSAFRSRRGRIRTEENRTKRASRNHENETEK